MFAQVMQGCIVTNEELERHGEAGCVVEDKTKVVNGALEGTVVLRMDADNELVEFAPTDLRVL
jgi:hypothetical protein